MRFISLALGAALILGLAVLAFFKFERRSPSASFAGDVRTVGRVADWQLRVQAPGRPGLRRVDVTLSASGKTYQLLGKDYPSAGWLGSGVSEDTLRIETDLGQAGLVEGPAVVQVAAETYAWHPFSPRRLVLIEQPIQVDLTPPRVELLSTQHNIRLGGSAAAVFRTSADASVAGVVVDRYYFPATLGYFADPSVAVALFAIPQDLTVDARPQIKVEDRVGNARLVALPCRIRDRSFPERAFNIDDAFLARKVPELEGLNKLTPKPDLVEGYLFINGPFRRETEARLDKLTARSVGRPLWDGGFRRQSNAANMSAFADRRVYMHDGREIDRQTHLGYDLASLEGATIEATQNGVVVFADDLGIYGGTVVLDHGLGVFSLYGHLRSISVKPGQEVKSGEGVGQSGETGLAGGDHLHFSIMIHGTHVDPVEWWDPKWIKDHVTEKLTMLPLAAQTAAPGTTANEPRRP